MQSRVRLHHLSATLSANRLNQRRLFSTAMNVAAAPLPRLQVRVPQRRALLVAVQYANLGTIKMDLPGTHRDPETVRKLLLGTYDETDPF